MKTFMFTCTANDEEKISLNYVLDFNNRMINAKFYSFKIQNNYDLSLQDLF